MSNQREYIEGLLGHAWQGGCTFSEHEAEMTEELDRFAAEIRAAALREVRDAWVSADTRWERDGEDSQRLLNDLLNDLIEITEGEW